MTFSDLCLGVLESVATGSLFYLASTHPSLYTKNPVHKLANLGYYVLRVLCCVDLLFAVAFIVAYINSHVSWH